MVDSFPVRPALTLPRPVFPNSFRGTCADSGGLCRTILAAVTSIHLHIGSASLAHSKESPPYAELSWSGEYVKRLLLCRCEVEDVQPLEMIPCGRLFSLL